MKSLCVVHALILSLTLSLSGARCVASGVDLESQACHYPKPDHATVSSEDAFEDQTSYMQSSTSMRVARDGMAIPKRSNKADTDYQHTTSMILHMVKARLSVGFIVLCVMVICMCILIVWWRRGWRCEAAVAKAEPEAEVPHQIGAQSNCCGFSTGLDWVCADSGQAFVGNRDILMQEQSQVRCRMLTAAIFGAITILILTVWASHQNGSLVLLGEGVHLFSDVVTYSTLLFAELASSSCKGDTASYSFGYGRAEVIISFLALSAQYIAMSRLLWSALERLQFPHQLADHGAEAIMLVGIASVIINSGVGAWMHLKGICLAHDHSTEGGSAAAYAKVHLLCDAAQNFIVLATGILVAWKPHLAMIEPMCTLAFSACFFYGTAGFMLQLIDILMERTPRSIDLKALHAELSKIKGVEEVHCLHVWKIAPGKASAIVHLCTADSDINEDVLTEAQILFQHRYAIKHCTIQVSEGDNVA